MAGGPRVLLVTVTVLSAWSGPVAADPQGNASLTVGGAGVGPSGAVWGDAEFHVGLRGDVLFARESEWDFGVGPYAEVGTFALDELQFGGGASVLFPVSEHVPLVLSTGGFGRIGDDDYGLEPGLSAALFVGTRSYNFHAGYSMAGGGVLAFRQSLGDSRESILLLAAQLDLAFMGIPLVMLIDWIRGPSSEVEPIPREE